MESSSEITPVCNGTIYFSTVTELPFVFVFVFVFVLFLFGFWSKMNVGVLAVLVVMMGLEVVHARPGNKGLKPMMGWNTWFVQANKAHTHTQKNSQFKKRKPHSHKPTQPAVFTSPSLPLTHSQNTLLFPSPFPHPFSNPPSFFSPCLCGFRCTQNRCGVDWCSSDEVLDVAKTMKASGLLAAGYDHINVRRGHAWLLIVNRGRV